MKHSCFSVQRRVFPTDDSQQTRFSLYKNENVLLWEKEQNRRKKSNTIQFSSARTISWHNQFSHPSRFHCSSINKLCHVALHVEWCSFFVFAERKDRSSLWLMLWKECAARQKESTNDEQTKIDFIPALTLMGCGGGKKKCWKEKLLVWGGGRATPFHAD